jgi:hypothetical protein
MIAGHAASPTTSPLRPRRPAILGETSIRRSVDPTHLPPPMARMRDLTIEVMKGGKETFVKVQTI